MTARFRSAAVATAITVLTVAAYSAEFLPTPGNDFINYDDDVYITRHAIVRDGLSFENAVWAFSSFHGANWFPLTRLSWMLDVSLFGVQARAFHLTSLLLHIASALLLFFAFQRMTRAVWASAFVAAVFALHPLHVESVAWAAYRRDVLSGFFFALSLLAYERHACAQRNPALRGVARWRPFILVATCLALGLMAKPTLVTLPFVFLLLDFWPLGRLSRGEGVASRSGWDPALVRRAILEKIPLLLMTATVSAVTLAAQHSWDAVQSLDRIPVFLRVGNALLAYTAYLATTFWPTDLCVFYPHPGPHLVGWQAALAALLLAGISLGCLTELRARPHLAVGWLWFLGMLVPVIGLVQVGAQARADRYMYLPLIGLSIAISWGVRELAMSRRGARRLAAAAAAGVSVSLAVATFYQVRVWRDTTTLFEHALRVTRNNYVAHINLGQELIRKERFEDARAHLVTALRIAPTASFAHASMGDAELNLENYREAEQHYRRALARKPRHATWNAGLAHALHGLGRYREAIETYRIALELDPGNPQVHVNLGLALAKTDRNLEAIASYERALELDPDLPEAHASLGVALSGAGRNDAAISHLERSVALEPGRAVVRAHLGRLLLEREDFQPASDQLAEAARLDPRNAAVRYLLAAALRRAGQPGRARSEMRHALAMAKANGQVELEAQIRGDLERAP